MYRREARAWCAAVGVSWDMGMAQGLRVGVWEGSDMVYCTTAASHLKVALGSSLGFGGLEEARYRCLKNRYQSALLFAL